MAILQCQIQHRSLFHRDGIKGLTTLGDGQGNGSHQKTFSLFRRSRQYPHPFRDKVIDNVF